MESGQWRDWYGDLDPSRTVRGARLNLSPVFQAEVSYGPDKLGDEKQYWWPILNGERLAGHSTLEKAKAHVDWEIWNRLRQIREGYRRVLDRRASWETGWQ
jgi:hypothetical protein